MDRTAKLTEIKNVVDSINLRNNASVDDGEVDVSQQLKEIDEEAAASSKA